MSLHCHLLIWLKELGNINLRRFSADIPNSDPDFCFLVCTQLHAKFMHTLYFTYLCSCTSFIYVCQHFYFQISKRHKSDKRSSDSIICDKTVVVDKSSRLQRSVKAYALNIRGYIDSISDVLKCALYVQSADGKAMLLQYVTSYVSKWKDGVLKDG